MFKPKKAIPALATGALTLAGCGGDGGGLSGAITNACSKYQECYPEEFALYFDSTKECVDYYLEYASEYSADCQNAAISYFNCYAALSCDEIEQGSDRCDDKYYAFYAACFL